jgi:hypothetical protein
MFNVSRQLLVKAGIAACARRLVAADWCAILVVAELSCPRWNGKPEDYHLRRCTGGYGEPGTRPVISADKAAAHNVAPPTKIKSQSKMLMARHFASGFDWLRHEIGCEINAAVPGS